MRVQQSVSFPICEYARVCLSPAKLRVDEQMPEHFLGIRALIHGTVEHSRNYCLCVLQAVCSS